MTMAPGQVFVGDALDFAARLEPASVQTIVTSPPYWRKRDYGQPGQIGQERTPGEYIERLVQAFRALRPALSERGTLWINVDDCYAAHGRMVTEVEPSKRAPKPYKNGPSLGRVEGFKRKDLIGLPWRLALALQADGWWVRADVIWHKPNLMPESVKDRPTRTHEYLFLLSKAVRYYYDADAIAEDASGTETRPQRRRALDLAAEHGLTPDHLAAIRACGATDAGKAQRTQAGHGRNAATVRRLASEAKAALGGYYREFLLGPRRNRRSVWTVPYIGFKGAHDATFPPELIRPCILAGCPPGGIVLDPFIGSGTVAQVAVEEGRRWIGCDLDPRSVAWTAERLARAQLRLPADTDAAD